MRTFPRSLVWLLYLAVALRAQAVEPPGMREDFAWFSAYGYPDNREFKFVRYTAYWFQILDHKPQPLYRYGWLLSENARAFTIRTPDDRTLLLERVKDGSKMSYEPADFAKYAESEVFPPQRDIADHPLRGPRLTRRPHLFLLGWLCAKRGLDDLTWRLYTTANHDPDFQSDPHDPREKSLPREPLRDRVERDIARYEMWHLVEDFGDLAISRAELLARAQAFPKRFPGSIHKELATSLADTLRTMVAEDATHPALTAEQLAKLPREEQIRELIFRLRDENVREAGGREAFLRSSRESDKGSAMHRLIAIGDPALPALIEALSDRRLTRSFGLRRHDEFSHYPVAVGDVALLTLEQIAQRVFYEKRETGALMMADGQTETVRAAVDQWWKERQTHGVAGALAAAVAKGDKNGVLAAERLLKEYPAQAATPLLAGAAAADSDVNRWKYFYLLSRLKDERVAPLLLQHVKEGTFLGTRAQAAAYLAKLGNMEGMPIVAEAWKSAPLDLASLRDWGKEKAISAFVLTDSPVGIRALADGLRSRSKACRHRVLEALDPAQEFWEQFILDGVSIQPRAMLSRSAETLTAIEDLLGAELEDNGEPQGSRHISQGGKTVSFNPRLCDQAARILAQRWPAKYKFPEMGTLVERERQRIVVLNTFRAARGLPPVPAAEPRPVLPEPECDKIAGVLFSSREFKMPEGALAFLRGARGRKVDEAFFEELRAAYLGPYMGVRPSDDHGFRLLVVRETDRTGTTLIVTPSEHLEAHRDRRLPTPRWDIDVTAIIPEERPVSGIEFEIFSREDPERKTNDHAIAPVLARAARVPPGQPLEIHFAFETDGQGQDSAF